MPSPFPGMNPYLEQEDAWEDFHGRFVPLAANILNAQAGPDYIVKLDERIYVHDVEEDARDLERDPFIEIRDRRNRQLVTVLELLSPSNKYAGRDRDQYVNKRDQFLAGPVHFVEIDLLRGGPRMPSENRPECDYCVLVSRAEHRPRAGLWPIRLRDPLPPIPVPLRAPHADLRLDLQAVLHQLYDAAGYEKFIYDSEPVPPLRPDDAAWVRQFVPQRG